MRWRSSRRWLNLVVAAGLLTVTSAGQAMANLPGSNFEGSDGNLVVNTAGNTDWANAPALVTKIDMPSGSTDNSFGQGAKEDISNPSVVSGSIPPSKSDLSRFYVSHDVRNGNFFLNLAWERTNVLGSANIDFEFNKSQTIDANGVTPVRTAGDLLFTYDFTNGGAKPTLGMLKWVTTGATSQCLKNNSLPCWGNRIDLSAAGFAEGEVNRVAVTDPIAPNAPRTLQALTFGEASINLTAAQVFPAGQCVNFASAYVKSRSSAEFNAELKDFIAPANAQISNCGALKIHKMTDPSMAAGSFGFTTTGGLTPAGFSLSDGGTQEYLNIQAGTYSVTESELPPPPPFDLVDIVCTSATGGSTSMINNRTATVQLVAGDTVDCTYTNKQRGTIVIQKTTDPTGAAQSFDFTSPTLGGFSLTDGTAHTFTGIVPGAAHNVAETVPAGWDLTSATCDNGDPVTAITVAAGATTTCTFVNTQRGSLTLHKRDDSGAAAPIQGATFLLYKDNDPFGGTRGAEDTNTGLSCTTDASGNCTVSNLLSGQYWVVEQLPVPAGYDPAPDQHVVVASAQTAELTFTDPRRFTVITVVCQESNNQLYPSTITVDGVDKTSLAHDAGLPGLTDAQICGIGGARYEGEHTGQHPANVSIPQ